MKLKSRHNYRIFLFVITVSLFTILLSCSSDNLVIYSDIDDYQTCLSEVEGADDFMPQLNALDDYESIELYCVEEVGVTVSVNLIVTYKARDYAERKADIDENYTFLGHPLYEGGRTLIKADRFEYNDFTIRVIEADSFRYPARFGMIGHAESSNQIAYMFFSDDSIISMEYTTMQEFVDSQFAFKEK